MTPSGRGSSSSGRTSTPRASARVRLQRDESLAADDPLRAALLVHGVELARAIGSGRFSTVWSGRWRGRDVAVKVTAPGAEGRGPTRLGAHPAILEALASGEALGRAWVAFERFPTDLRRVLAGSALRRELMRPVLVAIADALVHAHERGVAHGDVKPDNVLLDPDARPPRVVLADFGEGDPGSPDALADLEVSIASGERDEIVGAVATLGYLPPERLAGQPATPEGDVFALGVLLFEALTGRRPTGLERPSELVPGLDRRWDALVKACLAREPRERPRPADVRREVMRLLPRRDAAEPHPAGATDGAGASMVRIPGGFLVVGDRDDADARPMHEVQVREFRIDRAPVTVAAWEEYARATGAPRPRGWPARLPARMLELPVTGVSWVEASAFAAWRGARLPTEHEWERAAQGPEHRRFPWGDRFDAARVAREVEPVGVRIEGASSEGVFDLCGNVWEWTASPFLPYPGLAGGAAESAAPRVIRGGHDPSSPRPTSASARRGLRSDVADPGVGFRCASD